MICSLLKCSMRDMGDELDNFDTYSPTVKCPLCHKDTPDPLVTNVKTRERGCWECVVGTTNDFLMLRRLEADLTGRR